MNDKGTNGLTVCSNGELVGSLMVGRKVLFLLKWTSLTS